MFRDYDRSRSVKSYSGDLRAPERSVHQYASTGAQQIAPRRPPERLLNGLGPASFVYDLIYCGLGLVLLNIVTQRPAGRT
jgi:hypothetical protein